MSTHAIFKDKETHPSYGLLQISRINGNVGHLFGSPIEHSGSVRLRISQAAVHRDLSHDWYSDDDQIVEIEMSAAQFAEAITTLNCGTGTPCTIRHIYRNTIEYPPANDPRQKIKDEFDKGVKTLSTEFSKLVNEVTTILTDPTKKNLTKADKAEIINKLHHANMNLIDNLPYINKCFIEATEKTITAAKAELDAFITMMTIAAGKEALAGKPPPLPAIEAGL